MARPLHDNMSRRNALILSEGVRSGKSYAQIGREYLPPVTGSAAYKHALKIVVKNDDGQEVKLATLHPNHGKRRGPYTRNPQEAF